MSDLMHKMDLFQPTPQYYLFKKYCNAMLEFLQQTIYLNRFKRDDNVKIFFSTPSRAWAKYVQPLSNGLPTTPVVTFYLKNAEVKKEEMTGGNWVHEIFNHPTDQDKYVMSFAPSVWKLQFTVTLWAQTLNDMDNLISQLLTYTVQPSIWAGKIDDQVWYEIGFEGLNIEDELEPGETKDKIIRRSMNFYIPRAYFPRGYKEINNIKDIQIQMEHYINGTEMEITENLGQIRIENKDI